MNIIFGNTTVVAFVHVLRTLYCIGMGKYGKGNLVKDARGPEKARKKCVN